MPEGYGFLIVAIGAVATASFGALGWVGNRLNKDVANLWAAHDKLRDELWAAIDKLRDDTREYVTRRDLAELEQRLERSLSSHEQRLLLAIRLGMKAGTSADD